MSETEYTKEEIEAVVKAFDMGGQHLTQRDIDGLMSTLNAQLIVLNMRARDAFMSKGCLIILVLWILGIAIINLIFRYL